MKVLLSSASAHYRTHLLCLLLTLACLGFVKPAQAATCTLSGFTVSYSTTGNDTVSFNLAASVSSGYPSSFTLSYSVEAIPTYYDADGNVISSLNTVTVASGGSTTFPYNNNFNLYVNPRSNLEGSAPFGAVSYRYTYKISASVTNNQTSEVVASATRTYVSLSPVYNIP